jgi:ferredoxin
MSDHAILVDSSRSFIRSLALSECIFLSLGHFAQIMRTLGGANLNPNSQTDSVGRRSANRAYDAGYAWLTRPRSNEQLDLVVKSRCSCPAMHPQIQDSRTHALGREMARNTRPQSDPFHALLTVILSEFRRSDQMFDGNPAMPKLHLLSKRQIWPRSIHSLLPHGAEDTMRSLLQLFRIELPLDEYGLLYTALVRIIRLAHPLVLPYIVTSSSFVSYGIVGFSKKHATAQNQAGDLAQQHIDMRAVKAMYDFTYCMTTLAVRHANNVQRIKLNNQQPSAVLEAFARCVDVCHAYLKGPEVLPNRVGNTPHSMLGESIDQLVTLGGLVYDDCPISRLCAISMTSKNAFHQAARYSQPYSQTLPDRFRFAMHRLDIAQHCAAPECTRTRADGRLKRCSGCRRVHYCSRACQRGAWRSKIPHRDVCSKIVRLCAALKVPEKDPAEWNAPAFVDRPIPEQSARLVVDHFDKLAASHMSNPRKSTIPYVPFETNNRQSTVAKKNGTRHDFLCRLCSRTSAIGPCLFLGTY